MFEQIYPLLSYELRDNNSLNIRGPFSPTHAANTMAKVLEMKVKHLARINYKDEGFMQCLEDDGFTYYDHILIVNDIKELIQIYYFIDMGHGYMPIAGYFSDEPDEVIIAPIFGESTKFYTKITPQELIQLFKHVVANPTTYLSYNYNEVIQTLKN